MFTFSEAENNGGVCLLLGHFALIGAAVLVVDRVIFWQLRTRQTHWNIRNYPGIFRFYLSWK